MFRLAPLLLVLLCGCGSTAVAELPAPAGPPASPPLTAEPAGVVEPAQPAPDAFRIVDSAPCQDPLAEDGLAGGAQAVVLCGRARELRLLDTQTGKRVATASAGIGPTRMVTDGKDATYVVDSLGEALLVYRRRPFQLIRRVHLGGAPYAIAFDRERWGLWITRNGANDVVFYKAGWRPVLEQTYPSIRDARHIAAEGDEITVQSQTEVQRLRAK
ncbi:hypothetical protein DVA67_004615 [Solirubrobacter sp. CPCC 204708]|uniref:Lipoprotein n=1 Tax=Solirubrobacter deserti TaxID=2282478 RepID=A0ABT4RHC1_9ACTN|nr:hypothetical protein [Solirubrobacter deserti]MBE2315244.1 hypothetical protein [Solirubrobacter deserti]MDA0137928.1 hypothetical protein [Solirubrobacter deserti]